MPQHNINLVNRPSDLNRQNIIYKMEMMQIFLENKFV